MTYACLFLAAKLEEIPLLSHNIENFCRTLKKDPHELNLI